MRPPWSMPDDGVPCVDGMAKIGTEWLLAHLSPSCPEGIGRCFILASLNHSFLSAELALLGSGKGAANFVQPAVLVL